MIALSSAEAELYALLKCVCQTLGAINLALDFGSEIKAIVNIDASAALAITQRQGLGKFRNIAAHWLWIQEKVKNDEIKTVKIDGKQNPADLMMKHLNAEEISKHLKSLNYEIYEGRASKSLTMNKVGAQDNSHEGIPGAFPSGSGIRTLSDYWINSKYCAVMKHQRPRRNLFYPFQSQGAPRLGLLTSTRITYGVYIDDGTPFIKQDNWKCKTTQSIDLGRPWIGKTIFILKCDEIPDETNRPHNFICSVTRHESTPTSRTSVSRDQFNDESIAHSRNDGIDKDNSRTIDVVIYQNDDLRDSLRALRDFCVRACAAASPRPGRYPLPSVSQLLNSINDSSTWTINVDEKIGIGIDVTRQCTERSQHATTACNGARALLSHVGGRSISQHQALHRHIDSVWGPGSPLTPSPSGSVNASERSRVRVSTQAVHDTENEGVHEQAKFSRVNFVDSKTSGVEKCPSGSWLGEMSSTRAQSILNDVRPTGNASMGGWYCGCSIEWSANVDVKQRGLSVDLLGSHVDTIMIGGGSSVGDPIPFWFRVILSRNPSRGRRRRRTSATSTTPPP